jgi:hypothetical protein
MRRALAVLVSLLLTPNFGYSEIITNAETLGNNKYKVTASRLAGQENIPNPIFGWQDSGSGLRLALVYEGKTYHQAYNQCFIQKSEHPEITGFRTVGEVEQFWSNTSTGHSLPCEDIANAMFDDITNVRSCVMYGVISSTENLLQWPGSHCGYHPPQNNKCWVTPSVIELDHGSVSTDQVAGASVVTPVSVHCEKQLSVSLRMPNQGKIELERGLSSQIYINDNPGGGIVNGTPGGNSIIVKSTLQSNGTPQPGAYSNSSVINLTYD